MVNLVTVLNLVNARKNKVLRIAQAALTQHQFEAFRGLFLDEFGKNGLESELVEVFAEQIPTEPHGTGRHTLRKKGGVP